MDSVSQKNRALAEIDASGIAARQQWRHWKGGLYTIVGTGIVEATMDAVVMYAGADGVVWVRTLYVFLEEVAPGKRRFERVMPAQPWVGETIPDRCALSEGTCKAADCPEHGIFPREPAHPMMPRPRGGRYL